MHNHVNVPNATELHTSNGEDEQCNVLCMLPHTHAHGKPGVKPGRVSPSKGRALTLSALVVCEAVSGTDNPGSQSAQGKGGMPTYATGRETPGPIQIPRLKPATALAGKLAGQVRALSRAPRCEVGREPFPPRLAAMLTELPLVPWPRPQWGRPGPETPRPACLPGENLAGETTSACSGSLSTARGLCPGHSDVRLRRLLTSL